MPPSQYETPKKIASGGTSGIFIGRSNSGKRKVAVKKPTPGGLKFFQNEICALKDLKHPNIVRMVSSARDDSPKSLQLEFATEGNLADYIKTKFPKGINWEEIGNQWAMDLCSGLAYMHSKQWAHLDLTPFNILIFNDDKERLTLKLADLGLAMHLPIAEADFHGSFTPFYTSPEQTKCENVSEKSDIFVLGNILWEMHYGKPIGKDYSLGEYLKRVTSKTYPEKLSWFGIPNHVKTVIKKCWDPNPNKRPTANELYHIFKNAHEANLAKHDACRMR